MQVAARDRPRVPRRPAHRGHAASSAGRSGFPVSARKTSSSVGRRRATSSASTRASDDRAGPSRAPRPGPRRGRRRGAGRRRPWPTAHSRSTTPAAAATSPATHVDVDQRPTDPRLQLRRRAGRDHPPAVDDADLVRELVGLLEVLGGEQHGRALGHERRARRPRRRCGARVLSGRGLVEEEDARLEDRSSRRGRAAGASRPSTVLAGRRAASARPKRSSSSSARAPRGPRREVEEAPEHLEVLAAR